MEPIISIRNLRKYYGRKQVLSGINLDIYPGQIIGYIGPNGAGKSTTVKILAGIISDYAGTVHVRGQSLQEHALQVKTITGFVPEVAELYDLLTPYEYLHFIGKLHNLESNEAEERMMRMLETFDMVKHMHQRMDTFSKGMRQKVLLISGLIHDPEILILDEPLSGLDANAVILVKELLQGLKQEGKTIIYCSHMMDVVEKVSDRIILINEGSIIADATMDDLRTSEGESLEKVFSKLTSSEDAAARAEAFISVIGKKQKGELPND